MSKYLAFTGTAFKDQAMLVRALADIGWTIGKPDGGFGRYECVEHRTDGDRRVYAAASEMRADGCALAY